MTSVNRNLAIPMSVTVRPPYSLQADEQAGGKRNARGSGADRSAAVIQPIVPVDSQRGRPVSHHDRVDQSEEEPERGYCDGAQGERWHGPEERYGSEIVQVKERTRVGQLRVHVTRHYSLHNKPSNSSALMCIEALNSSRHASHTDVNAESRVRGTPLYAALHMGHLGVVRVLLGY